MKKYHKNPRQITGKQARDLTDSLDEFGDLSGIVHDLNSDEIIGGNQRGDSFNINHCEIEITHSFDEPDEQGTVAHGFIIWHGKRYAYRQVRWTPRQCEQANIQANKLGGTWDADILANEFDTIDLLDWGFEEWELGIEADKDDVGEQIESTTLAERFLVPPFSVLDARQGYWQERKRAWIALGIQSELGRGLINDAPGGSLLPATSLEGGHTVRGDGAGRKIKGKLPADSGGQPLPLDRKVKGKSPARCFGQDLMRGEHVVGENRLTWVAGKRNRDDLDEVSRKNLAGNRKIHSSTPPHGPNVTRAADGTLDYKETSGTSIFDPVLCELVYTWFCPPNGHILDPFAGGSVRGIVATKLGRQYTGVDLRAEQVAANMVQAGEIVPDAMPKWITGNSLTDMPDDDYDLVFTCPPYYDLEIYSDDPNDLSNYEDYQSFIEDYMAIIAESVRRLRDDRFACVVVGDIRAKDGTYRNFVSDTIAAFQNAGASLYNEAILVTATGSLPIRAGKQFSSGRKLGKTHQNVLVFIKGDWRKAVKACGPVEVACLDAAPEAVA